MKADTTMRGTMRPQRNPPYLLLALLTVTVILAFNVWNLTSKNYRLRTDLEILRAQHYRMSKRVLDTRDSSRGLQQAMMIHKEDLRKVQEESRQRIVEIEAEKKDVAERLNKCLIEVHTPRGAPQIENPVAHDDSHDAKSLPIAVKSKYNSSICNSQIKKVREEIDEWLKNSVDQRTQLQFQERFLKNHAGKEESRADKAVEEREAIIAQKDEEFRKNLKAAQPTNATHPDALKNSTVSVQLQQVDADKALKPKKAEPLALKKTQLDSRSLLKKNREQSRGAEQKNTARDNLKLHPQPTKSEKKSKVANAEDEDAVVHMKQARKVGKPMRKQRNEEEQDVGTTKHLRLQRKRKGPEANRTESSIVGAVAGIRKAIVNKMNSIMSRNSTKDASIGKAATPKMNPPTIIGRKVPKMDEEANDQLTYKLLKKGVEADAVQPEDRKGRKIIVKKSKRSGARRTPAQLENEEEGVEEVARKPLVVQRVKKVRRKHRKQVEEMENEEADLSKDIHKQQRVEK